MKTKTRCFFFFTLLFFAACTAAQVRVSIGTDLSLMRHLSKQEQFTVVGQTVQWQFHLSPQNTAYALINYFQSASFENNFSAVAKAASTIPQQKNYSVRANWKLGGLSLGWKRYLLGSFNNEQTLNLYATGGFGLLFITMENTSRNLPDTALYQLAGMPVIGKQTNHRLTLDLGVGAEKLLGGVIYVYGDIRSPLPVSSQPSPYKHTVSSMPKAVVFCLGIRILIGG